MSNQQRSPKGVPTGGQFSMSLRAESGIDLDVPVQEVLPDGTQMWRLNGVLHRDDGPAVVRSDGYEAWYQNGEKHRDDGPSVTFPTGGELWHRHGQLHRTDGPARTDYNGNEFWYFYDGLVDPP